MQIKTPYLLFLGDAHDQLAAKTAQGIAYWRPEWCIGQLRLPGKNSDQQQGENRYPSGGGQRWMPPGPLDRPLRQARPARLNRQPVHMPPQILRQRPRAPVAPVRILVHRF